MTNAERRLRRDIAAKLREEAQGLEIQARQIENGRMAPRTIISEAITSAGKLGPALGEIFVEIMVQEVEDARLEQGGGEVQEVLKEVLVF